METDISHPYYPLSAYIPGYTAAETPLTVLLPVFGGLTGAVIASAYYISGRASPRLQPIDRFAVAWFSLCGFLHLTFEGYYIYHRGHIQSMQTLYALLWKEYTLSDSRYLTSDVFTVSVEALTVAVWGPLCWLTVLAILCGFPTRHIYQIIICSAHLHSVTLYYLTNWVESQITGISYSRPEFLYFWVYYVGFNAPWAIVPFVLLYDSFKNAKRAFVALEKEESSRKNE